MQTRSFGLDQREIALFQNAVESDHKALTLSLCMGHHLLCSLVQMCARLLPFANMNPGIRLRDQPEIDRQGQWTLVLLPRPSHRMHQLLALVQPLMRPRNLRQKEKLRAARGPAWMPKEGGVDVATQCQW